MNPALMEGSLYVIRNYDSTFYYKDALCTIKHNPNGPAAIINGRNKAQEYWINGKLHREDGPAVILNNNESWYQNGKLHRLDGPAVTKSDGSEYWYTNGNIHRIDGPAWIDANGHKEWWQNGQLHREDGPAVIEDDGSLEEWHFHGEAHRLDGPAKTERGFTPGWFLFGRGYAAHIAQNIIKKMQAQMGVETLSNIPHDVLKEIFLTLLRN